MMFFAAPVGAFVSRHRTIKMLALSFLLLIGLNLIVEAFDVHVPKGYIYFAMGFLVFVELLNLAFAEKIVASRLTRSLRTRQRKTKLSYRMRL